MAVYDQELQHEALRLHRHLDKGEDCDCQSGNGSRQRAHRRESRASQRVRCRSRAETVDDVAASSGFAGRSSVVMPRAWFMAAS